MSRGLNEDTATSGLKYQFYCGTDAPGGSQIKDLAGPMTCTFSDCRDACAKMNDFVVRNNNGSL